MITRGSIPSLLKGGKGKPKPPKGKPAGRKS